MKQNVTAPPLISVIMGVYHPSDDTEDLFRSVRSILDQTCSDFEFLICDDGSGRAVVQLLDGLARTEKRIRLVRSGNAFTLPQKLNLCLAHAKGEYIARQDDDDLSQKTRFEKQIRYLAEHKDAAFVGCNAKEFRNRKLCGERRFPPHPEKEDFLFKMPFLHPTLMFRKSVLDEVGGYDESQYTVLCEDYDLLLKLYEKGHSGSNLQESLFFYQVTDRDYKKRRYRHRINEAVTRYRHFRKLGMLPAAWPFVVKPLAVGLIPHRALRLLKNGMKTEKR